jgi:apolipoprotein N-acyltransferase
LRPIVPTPEPALTAWKRLAVLGAAWLALYLAGPGILTSAGQMALAPLGLMLWGLAASRPGPKAFLVEWLTAGIAWAAICSWAAWVWWGTLLFIGPGMGLYLAFAGWLLKRFARRAPLALAVPIAWVGVEALRTWVPTPPGLTWMRLGTHLHDSEWIAGSARVWGFGGLSFVLAAAGGALADIWRHLTVGPGASAPIRPRLRWAVAAGALPAVLGIALANAVPAPQTVAGPVVLLVQPGFPQARKMDSREPRELFRESRELTLQGLQEARRAAEPPPDLIAWGETMLPIPILDPQLHEALRAGALPDPWSRMTLKLEDVPAWLAMEDNAIGDGLFGSPPAAGGVIPEGSVFVSGAEYWTAKDGRVRRQNAVFLWKGPGERSQAVGKLHLVPGAETMLGLERWSWIRDRIFALAGYVPDLLEAEGDRVLRFRARDGREFAFGASICFDNAFDDPYAGPLREGDVDFHLVVSNEAWFRSSQEADQMLAFSRLLAIETGRSIVRATNSGVSAVLDPEGREVAHLQVGERDREVRGTLRASVPVPDRGDPAGAARAGATPFVRWELAWTGLWLLLPLVLLAVGALQGGNRSAPAG